MRQPPRMGRALVFFLLVRAPFRKLRLLRRLLIFLRLMVPPWAGQAPHSFVHLMLTVWSDRPPVFPGGAMTFPPGSPPLYRWVHRSHGGRFWFVCWWRCFRRLLFDQAEFFELASAVRVVNQGEKLTWVVVHVFSDR